MKVMKRHEYDTVSIPVTVHDATHPYSDRPA
jgi:hypothetical protein